MMINTNSLLVTKYRTAKNHAVFQRGRISSITACGKQLYHLFGSDKYKIAVPGGKHRVTCLRCIHEIKKSGMSQKDEAGLLGMPPEYIHALELYNTNTGIKRAVCGLYIEKGQSIKNTMVVMPTRETITCPQCRKLLNYDSTQAEPVGKDKEVFYEIRLKGGSGGFVHDMPSAQAVAEWAAKTLKIPMTDIECINRVRVEAVIFPTIAIEFKE